MKIYKSGPGIGFLDSRYVNITGDTMTGNLIFSGSQSIIGGTGTTSDLTLQTTSGVGATGADMHFLVGNNGATEAMTILNDGSVGIGTTGPTNNLHIYNNVDGNASVAIQNPNTGTSGRSILTIGTTEAAGNTNLGLVYSNVNYTLGAGYELLAGDRALVYANSGATNGLGLVSVGTGPIVFGTGGWAAANERMRITTSGNVGIGTTSPTYLLSLSGQAAQIIWTERNVTAATAGQNLTLRIGGAVAGGTNLGGGVLTLAGGTSTGTGTSGILLQTAPAGGTGTADNALATMMTVTGNTLGFYAAAPVALQTGVAVTAAGIHAALVNLGLITA